MSKIDCVYHRDGTCFNEAFVSSLIPGKKTMTVHPRVCKDICEARVSMSVKGVVIPNLPPLLVFPDRADSDAVCKWWDEHEARFHELDQLYKHVTHRAFGCGTDRPIRMRAWRASGCPVSGVVKRPCG